MSFIMGDVVVPAEVVAIFGVLLAAFIAAAVGLFAWCLKQVVSLAQVVERLSARSEDFSRRLDDHDDLLKSHPEIRS